MCFDQVIGNLNNVGNLMTAVAIIASWTTFGGPDKIRGTKLEKFVYSILDISLGFGWLVLILLLLYGLCGENIFFYISYIVLFLVIAVQLFIFFYLSLLPKLFPSKNREEMIDNDHAKYLKKKEK